MGKKVNVLGLFVVIILLTLTSCKKCTGDDPILKFSNNTSGDITLIVSQLNENIIETIYLEKGEISEEKKWTFEKISVEYKVSNKEYKKDVSLEKCTHYNITISSDNDIIIFSQSKK